MRVDPDNLRHHYESMSDEELLQTDPDEITDAARGYYEREIAKRGLAGEAEARKEAVPDAKLVVVCAFGTAPEAEMAKSVLESAEIDAVILADDAGGMRPHLAWASGGYKLLVREEDAAAARAALIPLE
jgi:hypothetical protein